ncbi:unnamed protein product, partial [Rotaria magnacalcarata]
YNLNGESWKCFKIFEEMKEKDIIPGEIAWNILIGACSKSGDATSLSIYCESNSFEYSEQDSNAKRID